MIVHGIILDGPGCALVAQVIAEGVHRRRARGEVIGVDLLAQLEEVETVARAWRAASASGNPELPQHDESDVTAEYVSTQDAAVILGVSPRRVRQLIADGRLSGRKQHGAWIVSAAEVEQLARRTRT